jgi:hypothetical protein
MISWYTRQEMERIEEMHRKWQKGFVVPSGPSTYPNLLPCSDVQVDICQDVVTRLEAIRPVNCFGVSAISVGGDQRTHIQP